MFDAQACEQIVRYELARFRVRVGALPGMDLDDVAQEVRLAVFRAQTRVDPSRKGRTAYLYQSARNRLKDLARNAYTLSRMPRDAAGNVAGFAPLESAEHVTSKMGHPGAVLDRIEVLQALQQRLDDRDWQELRKFFQEAATIKFSGRDHDLNEIRAGIASILDRVDFRAKAETKKVRGMAQQTAAEELPECHAQGQQPIGYDMKDPDCTQCLDKFTCLPAAIAGRLTTARRVEDADKEVAAYLLGSLTFDAAQERMLRRHYRMMRKEPILDEEGHMFEGLLSDADEDFDEEPEDDEDDELAIEDSEEEDSAGQDDDDAADDASDEEEELQTSEPTEAPPAEAATAQIQETAKVEAPKPEAPRPPKDVAKQSPKKRVEEAGDLPGVAAQDLVAELQARVGHLERERQEVMQWTAHVGRISRRLGQLLTDLAHGTQDFIAEGAKEDREQSVPEATGVKAKIPEASTAVRVAPEPEPEPRKRGRPRKTPVEQNVTVRATSAIKALVYVGGVRKVTIQKRPSKGWIWSTRTHHPTETFATPDQALSAAFDYLRPLVPGLQMTDDALRIAAKLSKFDEIREERNLQAGVGLRLPPDWPQMRDGKKYPQPIALTEEEMQRKLLPKLRKQLGVDFDLHEGMRICRQLRGRKHWIRITKFGLEYDVPDPDLCKAAGFDDTKQTFGSLTAVAAWVDGRTRSGPALFNIQKNKRCSIFDENGKQLAGQSSNPQIFGQQY